MFDIGSAPPSPPNPIKHIELLRLVVRPLGSIEMGQSFAQSIAASSMSLVPPPSLWERNATTPSSSPTTLCMAVSGENLRQFQSTFYLQVNTLTILRLDPISISTASKVNGALVLRHELGHSIIEVGEEYDGGYAYFGVNSQATPEDVKWRHWLTSTDLGRPSPILQPTRIERSNMPLQLYPWTYLTDASTPFRASFYASGTFSRYSILFSVSGAAQKSDLIILLDGRNVEFNPRKDIGRDRWHYEIHSSKSALPRNLDSQAHASGNLEEGMHEIEFRLGPTAHSGQVQLCSVEILEFGDEEE